MRSGDALYNLGETSSFGTLLITPTEVFAQPDLNLTARRRTPVRSLRRGVRLEATAITVTLLSPGHGVSAAITGSCGLAENVIAASCYLKY